MAHEGINDVSEYDDKVFFLLSPAFRGEMHWHVHLREWEAHIICVHGWRQQALDFVQRPTKATPLPGTPEVYYSSCRFSHDPNIYGAVDWVPLESGL